MPASLTSAAARPPRPLRARARGRTPCAQAAAPAFAVEASGRPEDVPAGVRETFRFDLGGPERTTVSLERGEGATLVPLTVERPLGVVFEAEAEDGRVVVAELVDDSNAGKAGVKVGDVLRATTAVFKVKGKVDELAFYGNPPSDSYLPGVVTVRGDFDEAIAAIQSHATPFDAGGGQRVESDVVALVVERPNP